MGYFHSASSWKCSALAWPRGRERAGVGRQGSSRRMRGSSPSLDKSLSIRESTMGRLGDAACLRQVRCLLGSTHSQARAGGCSGPSGDTHTQPLARPRGAPLQSCLSSRKAALEGDPAQTRCPSHRSSSGKALLPRPYL